MDKPKPVRRLEKKKISMPVMAERSFLRGIKCPEMLFLLDIPCSSSYIFCRCVIVNEAVTKTYEHKM